MTIYMIRHPIQSDVQLCLVGLELLTRRLNTLGGISETHCVKRIRRPRYSVPFFIFDLSGGIHSTFQIAALRLRMPNILIAFLAVNLLNCQIQSRQSHHILPTFKPLVLLQVSGNKS